MVDETEEHKIWKNAKAHLGEKSITLGPYFSHQAIDTPWHLLFTYSRYKFAMKLLSPYRRNAILELGCGEGLGSIMLAAGDNTLKGIDFDEGAIEHAKRSIPRDNMEFSHDDFILKQYGDFDAVISLDVIEHIAKKNEDNFVKTIILNLKNNGVAIVGTPNITASKYASKESQAGHINMYDEKRLRELLEKYFHNVFIFGLNDEVVHTGYYPMCHYIMAVCCNKRRSGGKE